MISLKGCLVANAVIFLVVTELCPAPGFQEPFPGDLSSFQLSVLQAGVACAAA
jgi:hypothetical protein